MTQDRGAFIWYELMTDDPAGAKAFYDAVVGWTMQAEGMAMPNGSEYRLIGRADGGHVGGVLTITTDMAAHGVRPGWFCYIHTPDVDAAVQQVLDAGGALHMPATTMAAGRMAMVSDPWGAVFYLMDPVPPPGQPDARSDVFDPARPQHMRWNELWTPDPDAAIGFYCDLAGWTQEGAMDMGPMGQYRFLQQGGLGIGAVGTARPDGPGAHWSYFIGVDDIDRAVAAVKAGGGSVDNDPMMIPGGEWSTYCKDPQGAVFGLVGPRKE